MSLGIHIKDLLYRYDCVIVPDFGGFVTNKISAKIHTETNTFHPPKKQVSFNSHLTHNDGLLANYIASVENISFDLATAKILEIVSIWNATIKTKSIEIDDIGSIYINKENQLIFNPISSINYLKSSFGLVTVDCLSIDRVVPTKAIPLVPNQSQKSIFRVIKYAAAAILLSLSYVGYLEYENKQDQLNFVKNQKKIEEQIQSATFIIENPLPTIELNVNREPSKSFHIVAGSFQFLENAHRKVNQLNAKGFKATILGKNKWGLTQVAYASFITKKEAFKSLATIRKIDSKDAWLLVKTFD